MKISNLDKGVINDTARLALRVIDHSDIYETIAKRRSEHRAQRYALNDQQMERALPRHRGGGRLPEAQGKRKEVRWKARIRALHRACVTG